MPDERVDLPQGTLDLLILRTLDKDRFYRMFVDLLSRPSSR